MIETGTGVREARATDLLDGALEDQEIAALLAADPELADEVDAARDAQALLRQLPSKPVPRDFLRKVQRRVRRRSGGRFFHPAVQPFGFRLSVEVFVVVAVAVMAACWFIIDTGHRAGPGPLVEEPPIERVTPDR
jgi:anti-sigma factor RsiW